MQFLVPVLCYLAVAAYANPFRIGKNDTLNCGYQTCPATDPDKINVHLIPHSHDDLGWLKTVEKFIQVETAYFYKWWTLQEDDMKNSVKQLINEGRLEIINGGWSMNDEANTHYQSTIDQFTLGHKWLSETFGECAITNTGWQIDPFGHSREQASIYSQMGFDSFFFMRYDYRDQAKRKQEKNHGLAVEGETTYAWPVGFCYDITCGDTDVVEDVNSPESYYEKIVSDFAGVIKTQAEYYPTNNIFITMGDDVHYTGATKNFVNIDRLIKGFAKYNPIIDGKEVNIFYSTPSCYAKAVNDFVNREKLHTGLQDRRFYAPDNRK
ncbi:hypothetical protein NQ318_012293 [Aromia moschata]|uniref:Glycoside hydrolase family 38 N-terminal domain-containing protein n=1 Tax=Aromia moschata TaxID=1265417 RepID=A0AAV8YKB6_9CUCU|nr:hypothetical protein NQ318_012293 [Aromia moschata]